MAFPVLGNHALASLSLVVLVFSLGCAAPYQGTGLKVNMQPDPPVIFENSMTRIHVDVINDDVKRLENVKVQIFDPGKLFFANEADCRRSGEFNFLLPQEFRTFSCVLNAQKINQDRVTSEIGAKAAFDATLSAVQQIELMTGQEYNNRLASTGVVQKPQSYVYGDSNIQLEVEFSQPLPVVIQEDRSVFVKFSVRNVGRGFVTELQPQDVELLQKGSLNQPQEGNILQIISPQGRYEPCRLQNAISPIGKEFPSFSCQVLMPAGVNVLTNYNVIISVRYHYEIRDSVSVDVIR